MKAFWIRILLVLIPLVTLEIFTETIITSRFQRQQDGFKRQVSERIESLAVESDPELFLKKSLVAALHWFQRVPKLSLSRLMLFLKTSAIGENFDLYSTSAFGEFLEVLPSEAPNQWLIRKLFQALMSQTKRPDQEKELQRLLPAVFGLGKGIDWFRKNQGKVCIVRYQGTEARLLWERGKKAGILIICRTTPDLGSRFKKARGRVRISEQSWCGIHCVWMKR